jgi:hypothetical protein
MTHPAILQFFTDLLAGKTVCFPENQTAAIKKKAGTMPCY